MTTLPKILTQPQALAANQPIYWAEPCTTCGGRWFFTVEGSCRKCVRRRFDDSKASARRAAEALRDDMHMKSLQTITPP